MSAVQRINSKGPKTKPLGDPGGLEPRCPIVARDNSLSAVRKVGCEQKEKEALDATRGFKAL